MKPRANRPLHASAASIAVACLLSTNALAGPTPAEKCEGLQLKHAGLYAACRLKADSKSRLKGQAPDYTKCEETLATKFGKAEDKAGPGVCPTEGHIAAIKAILDEAAATAAQQLAAPDASCPPGYRDRDANQVLADRRAAASAQNIPLFLCNYEPWSFILDDQGVLVGHADIGAAAQSLWNLFDGVAPTINSSTTYEDTTILLSRLDGGWIEIKDKVDTFVIRNGRIQAQTSHGLITFNGPPPDQS